LLPRSWTKSCNGHAGEHIASMAFYWMPSFTAGA
jgi:hypothetical protein